jgi:glycerol uptake facilitator-like aquaporin
VDAGVGSSIGGIKEAASVMIYIIAAMVATVIGAAMVVVWVRSVCSTFITFSVPR